MSAWDDSPESERFGVVGAVLALLGGTLIAIALIGADWYRSSGPSIHFSDLHRDVADSAYSAALVALVARIYFGWLGRTLAVVAVALAVAANVPSPASIALRVFGAVVGLSGVVLTLLSIKVSTLPGTGFAFFLKRMESDFYLAASGFLVVAVGAMVGPRRVN